MMITYTLMIRRVVNNEASNTNCWPIPRIARVIYIQGNDDDKLSDELVGICDKIIEELAPVGAYTDSDYADKVDTLVDNMVASDDNVYTHDSEGC